MYIPNRPNVDTIVSYFCERPIVVEQKDRSESPLILKFRNYYLKIYDGRNDTYKVELYRYKNDPWNPSVKVYNIPISKMRIAAKQIESECRIV